MNNKIYIGQTIRNLEERIKNHLSKTSGCRALKSALVKYGLEAFKIEIIYYANSIEELNIKEEYYINYYNSLSPNGYNLTKGGKNRSPSEETRKIWSKQRIGRKPTKEQLKKQSDALINKPLSEEHKLKISLANKGKIRTEEMKEHQRKLKLGKSNIHVIKKIIDQYGNIYNSLTEASKKLNLSISKISLVLKGKRNHTGGYKFKLI